MVIWIMILLVQTITLYEPAAAMEESRVRQAGDSLRHSVSLCVKKNAEHFEAELYISNKFDAI